ncbi:MAG: hypothetical protein LBI06_07815 [Treponema sp.]|jgi:hypothetical protein|nr:hypothetical protein [Treponema sp.]
MSQINVSGIYMVPSKVYVGDRASLVLPLPGVTGDINAKISLGPDVDFSYFSTNIEIHQIAIERRPTGSFLTIEFSAYTPGILELPPLDIGGEIVSGLQVEISSILASDESGTVLSGPALPLAIPGTSLLIYGTVSSLLLITLLAAWALLWGRKRMNGWFAVLKRKRLLVLMAGTEKRLHRALIKGAACREILDNLSMEFRGFLALFTGENYRAMTAAEIGRLGVLNSEFLGSFFDRCDGIRFRGGEIDADETLVLLDDLRRFLAEAAA